MATTKKKKNRALPLIVLTAVLLAFVIGYRLLVSANERREAEEADREAAANQPIQIASYDPESMTALSYQARGADPLSFTLKNGTWHWDGDAEFPVEQTILTQMANAISNIGVQQRVEEGDPAAYGLTEPEFLITASYSGYSHEYRIGDYNTFSGSYYFMADESIYMISSGLLPYFEYELDDLLAKDTLPASDWTDETAVSSVTVTADGSARTITDDETKTAALAAIRKLSFYSCSDYDTTEEEKAAFGIDGTSSVSVTYKKAVTSTDGDGNESTNYLDTTYTVQFGGTADEEGKRYGGPAKSKLTYVLDGETVASILAFAEDQQAEDQPAEDGENA